MSSTWQRIVEHASSREQVDDLPSPLAELQPFPTKPIRVGGRELFVVPSEDEENWPGDWIPLEPVADHATLVMYEDAVWIGRREGRGPELDDEPLFESLDALLESAATILELAEWEVDGDARWLTEESEDALWKALPDASKLFDFFRLETREMRIRYLVGELRGAAVLTMLGTFFLLCTLAFLAAPFGNLAVRVGFVVVIGCVPLALSLYGYRALRRARAGLSRLS